MMPNNDKKSPIEERGAEGIEHNAENTPFQSIVTELTPNDILLGRGAPIINYEGNVRFRALVKTKKVLYNNTCRHSTKDEIAREVIAEINRRNGRFLTKIESQKQAQLMGVLPGQAAWTIADDSIILEKVKQALRDKKPERRIMNMAVSTSGTTKGDSTTSDSLSELPLDSSTTQNNQSLTATQISDPVLQNTFTMPLSGFDSSHISVYNNDNERSGIMNQGFGDVAGRIQEQLRQRDLLYQILAATIPSAPQQQSPYALTNTSSLRELLLLRAISQRNIEGTESNNVDVLNVRQSRDQQNSFDTILRTMSNPQYAGQQAQLNSFRHPNITMNIPYQLYLPSNGSDLLSIMQQQHLNNDSVLNFNSQSDRHLRQVLQESYLGSNLSDRQRQVLQESSIGLSDNSMILSPPTTTTVDRIFHVGRSMQPISSTMQHDEKDSNDEYKSQQNVIQASTIGTSDQWSKGDGTDNNIDGISLLPNNSPTTSSSSSSGGSGKKPKAKRRKVQ